MRANMIQNLGQTRLRGRRRLGSAMQAYDALPSPLRQWLAAACLPWSPASAKRIWTKGKARGLSNEEVLASLSEIEAKMMARDRLSLKTI